MRFRGDEPLPLDGMQGLLDQLGDIDALENLMRNATSPGPLAEVRSRQGARAAREDAARSMQHLAKIVIGNSKGGCDRAREGRMELTPMASAGSGNARSAISTNASCRPRRPPRKSSGPARPTRSDEH
jgi:hypothetical protein